MVSSVANVVVSCLLCRQQEHAGLNPTESMTRALISDDNIARQSALGTVQLGYVLPLLVIPSIPTRSQESEELNVSLEFTRLMMNLEQKIPRI